MKKNKNKNKNKTGGTREEEIQLKAPISLKLGNPQNYYLREVLNSYQWKTV